MEPTSGWTCSNGWPGPTKGKCSTFWTRPNSFAWWTVPADGDFGLVYAGQSKGERAIALLFSDVPDAAALEQSIKVYNIKGVLVSGTWTTASNPRQGLLRKLKPGRYTVVIDSSFVSVSGKTISKGLHGPVYIQ